jgi:hypothetical protein
VTRSQETSAPESERYILITGGDGYGTVTVTGRETMERTFVRLHWPEADFANLSEEEKHCLDGIRDEDGWTFQPDFGRVHYGASYECDWVDVYRVTDTLTGFLP